MYQHGSSRVVRMNHCQAHTGEWRSRPAYLLPTPISPHRTTLPSRAQESGARNTHCSPLLPALGAHNTTVIVSWPPLTEHHTSHSASLVVVRPGDPHLRWEEVELREVGGLPRPHSLGMREAEQGCKLSSFPAPHCAPFPESGSCVPRLTLILGLVRRGN